MALHTAPENKLFSTVAHGLLNEKYAEDIRKLFAELQILEASARKYQSIPLYRKQERLKQSFTLFRVYWQNALKVLLPFIRAEELNSQRLFMRYGLVHITDISAEDREALEMIALHAEHPSFVFYIDEWFHNVATGKVRPMQQRENSLTKSGDKKNNRNSLQLIREATSLEGVVEKLCLNSKSVATPFLHENDLSGRIMQQLASRETVQRIVTLIKNIDPQLFTRKLLKEIVTLEPYIILVPCYANFGTCWEAFDRLERTTSRGRVVVPLYAPNTQRAVLVALANYRWESAKLAAGGYWLEKGLTGGFYDLYRKYSLPGKNEQQAFVAAYCHWILDEAQGQIRFGAEQREFFWKEIPFAEKRRQMLVQYFAQFRDLL